MTRNALKTLRPGQQYRVRIRHGRTATRIFLFRERRFGIIPCAVFSAPVRGPVTVHVIKPGHLRISGPTPPRSEISVPHYDLLQCNPMATCQAQADPIS